MWPLIGCGSRRMACPVLRMYAPHGWVEPGSLKLVPFAKANTSTWTMLRSSADHAAIDDGDDPLRAGPGSAPDDRLVVGRDIEAVDRDIAFGIQQEMTGGNRRAARVANAIRLVDCDLHRFTFVVEMWPAAHGAREL